jgi:Polysaccharide deacetylase
VRFGAGRVSCFPSRIPPRATHSRRARDSRLAALLLVVLVGALLADVRQDAQARGRVRGPVLAAPQKLFPRFDAAVPVLLYHRILREAGRGVALETFEAHMRRLHARGFHTVTLDEYVRFVRGDRVDLPARPILITFDDANASALQLADPVLARHGWSAVMYVPTGAVGLPGRLTWDELRRMRSSGRWQIEEHAGDGHTLITVDDSARREPFYANEAWTNGRRETFAQYKARVRSDIRRGSALLARNLPGWTPHASFAVPFGDYGQRGSNDPRIEPWLTGYLKTTFSVVFVQRGDGFTTSGPGFANRITVASRWDADELERHLYRGRARLGGPVGPEHTVRRPRRG